MKIFFVISSLRGGGAERVASTLCNYWAEAGHEVVLLTQDESQNDFYKTHPVIHRYILGGFGIKRNFIKRIFKNIKVILNIRRVISKENPDVVVSFVDIQNMQTILACLFSSVPVIISERTYPAYFNNNNLFDIVRKNIYKFAKYFVAQTNDVAVWARDFLSPSKIVVIANPLHPKFYSENIIKLRHKNIIAIGRLCEEKGFDILIRAYQRLHIKYPDWSLLIIGDGPTRKNLEQQIKKANLEGMVVLTGKSNNLEQYYAKAQIFVLSSRVEGFPNVLLESMAAGMAVVSFNCKSGPADLISHEINGLLVESDNELHLSKALERLIKDDDLRKKLSTEAVKVREKYKQDIIANQWLNIFTKIVNANKV